MTNFSEYIPVIKWHSTVNTYTSIHMHTYTHTQPEQMSYFILSPPGARCSYLWGLVSYPLLTTIHSSHFSSTGASSRWLFLSLQIEPTTPPLISLSYTYLGTLGLHFYYFMAFFLSWRVKIINSMRVGIISLAAAFLRVWRCVRCTSGAWLDRNSAKTEHGSRALPCFLCRHHRGMSPWYSVSVDWTVIITYTSITH